MTRPTRFAPPVTSAVFPSIFIDAPNRGDQSNSNWRVRHLYERPCFSFTFTFIVATLPQRITKDDVNGETALVDTDVCRPRKHQGQPI